MSGHTPGPWEVIPPPYAVVRTIPTADMPGFLIADCSRAKVDQLEFTIFDNSEARANARLIAAAPDMEEKIAAVLNEWDILPSDKVFTLAEVTDWLQRFMAPAIEDLRAAIVRAQARV